MTDLLLPLAVDQSAPAEQVDERGRDARLGRLPQEIPPAPPATPCAAEKRRMRAAARTVAAKPTAPELRLGETASGQLIIGLPHTDAAGWLARAKLAFGTVSAAFVESEIHRLIRALQALRDDLSLEDKLNAALAVIEGVRPRSEVEAMLASQMALSHVAALEMITRLHSATGATSDERIALFSSAASKLMRAFSGHVETLGKLRRPPVQVVRVERVEVKAGGQALVGIASTAPGGGLSQIGDQTYGADHERALELAHHTPVRRPQARRRALPAAAEQGQDAMQAPRRSTRDRRPTR